MYPEARAELQQHRSASSWQRKDSSILGEGSVRINTVLLSIQVCGNTYAEAYESRDAQSERQNKLDVNLLIAICRIIWINPFALRDPEVIHVVRNLLELLWVKHRHWTFENNDDSLFEDCKRPHHTSTKVSYS